MRRKQTRACPNIVNGKKCGGKIVNSGDQLECIRCFRVYPLNFFSKKRTRGEALQQFVSTYIRDQGVEVSYRGKIETLAQEMMSKKEGVYLAYDELLFDVLYELGHKLKKEPAHILWMAIEKGLHILIEEAAKQT